MKNQKYVSYFRVSTKRQGESGLGLDAQRTYINYFYKDAGFISEFTENVSGKEISNRPELLKAIEVCKKQKATLVVAKIDRLSRNTEQALLIYRELEGRLESCDIPNLDKFTLTLFMAIADRERELISIRTTQALAEKKKKGFKLGLPANFTDQGRSKGVASRVAVARESNNNKQVTKFVVDEKAKGKTLKQIAESLNSHGYKTSRGKEFQTGTIDMLLKRLIKVQIQKG